MADVQQTIWMKKKNFVFILQFERSAEIRIKFFKKGI